MCVCVCVCVCGRGEGEGMGPESFVQQKKNSQQLEHFDEIIHSKKLSKACDEHFN